MELRVRPREMKPGHWFWLERSVIREYLAKVGPSAFAVYCFLASCVDKAQRCFPSQGYIAQGLGCSRSTVSRGMDDLERARLISRSTGQGGRTEYQLLAADPEKGVDNSSDDCIDDEDLSQPRTSHVARVDTIYIQQREEINYNSSRNHLVAQDLADALNNPGGIAIYEAYARKYPEQILRRVLAEANAIPTWKITKSRAHLFTYLLKKYV